MQVYNPPRHATSALNASAPSSTRRNHLLAFLQPFTTFLASCQSPSYLPRSEPSKLFLAPGVALSPNQLPKHRPPWQTLLFHTHHESREQYPPSPHRRLNALGVCRGMPVDVGEGVVFMLLFPQDEASEKHGVVDLPQVCSDSTSRTLILASRSPRLSASAVLESDAIRC